MLRNFCVVCLLGASLGCGQAEKEFEAPPVDLSTLTPAERENMERIQAASPYGASPFPVQPMRPLEELGPAE